MAAVAAISAVLTATVVIGAGRVILHKPQAAAAADQPRLIQIADR